MELVNPKARFSQKKKRKERNSNEIELIRVFSKKKKRKFYKNKIKGYVFWTFFQLRLIFFFFFLRQTKTSGSVDTYLP